MERPQCAFSMLHKWDDEESKKSHLVITFTYRTSKTSKVLPFSHSISSGFTPYVWFFVVLSVLSVTYKGNLVYCFHLDDSLVVMCFFHCMPCHSHRRCVIPWHGALPRKEDGVTNVYSKELWKPWVASTQSAFISTEDWNLIPKKIMIYGVSYMCAYICILQYQSIHNNRLKHQPCLRPPLFTSVSTVFSWAFMTLHFR